MRPIDGPFGDFNDPDGYILAAKRGAAIGIEGKWAIHPSQIEHANAVFSPPEAEVDKAKRIIEEHHNGKIFVLNSELNNGTTFRISFPSQQKTSIQ